MVAKKKAPTKKRTPTLDRLIAFLKASKPRKVGKEIKLDDPLLTPILALANECDPKVHEWIEILVSRPTAFGVFDIEMYPTVILRGKKGEWWNDKLQAIGAREVCLAINGAGDLYVWNADSGSVRFLIHDEGMAVDAKYASVEEFLEATMQAVVEAADADQVTQADETYLACLRFAIDVASSDDLDADAREKLVERGVLEE